MNWILESLRKKQKLTLNDVIDKVGDRYGLLQKFRETPQDKEWHSEGDVHIHTDMVIQETYRIFEKEKFSERDQLILIMAAIFHDICKPLTTKERIIKEKIRVVAPKHEEMGLSYLFYRLIEEDIEEEVRNSVLELVGYHQQPKLLVVKNKGIWHYKYLTRNIPGYLFYYHQIADMRGRVCGDKNIQLEYLEEFKMFCEEYNCFYTRSGIDKEIKEYLSENFNFNGDSDLLYIEKKALTDLIKDEYEDPIVAYQKYFEKKDNYPRLFLMCGLSGSGKSTQVRELKEKWEAEVISLDEIRKDYKINNTNRKSVDGKVLQVAMKRLKECLANNINVIWDACNIRKDFREKIMTVGEKYGSLNCIVFVKNSLSRCIYNDSLRSDGFLGKEVIEEQYEKFQYPEDKECNLKILVLGG